MITQRDLECEIKELQLEIEDHQKAIGKLKTYLERKELQLKEMTNQQPLDIIEIGGVKYKRVEEQKPITLENIIAGCMLFHNNEIQVKLLEHILDRIEKEWLPNEVIEDGEDYNNGWNDCLQYLKENLK